MDTAAACMSRATQLERSRIRNVVSKRIVHIDHSVLGTFARGLPCLFVTLATDVKPYCGARYCSHIAGLISLTPGLLQKFDCACKGMTALHALPALRY